MCWRDDILKAGPQPNGNTYPKRPITQYFMMPFTLKYVIFGSGWIIWALQFQRVFRTFIPETERDRANVACHNILDVILSYLMLIWTFAFAHLKRYLHLLGMQMKIMTIKENWLRFMHTYYVPVIIYSPQKLRIISEHTLLSVHGIPSNRISWEAKTMAITLTYIMATSFISQQKQFLFIVYVLRRRSGSESILSNCLWDKSRHAFGVLMVDSWLQLIFSSFLLNLHTISTSSFALITTLSDAMSIILVVLHLRKLYFQ